MATLNRYTHSKFGRKSVILTGPDVSLSSGKSGRKIGQWDRFTFSIRGEVKGKSTSFEIEMTSAEAVNQLRSFAEMLDFKVEPA